MSSRGNLVGVVHYLQLLWGLPLHSDNQACVIMHTPPCKLLKCLCGLLLHAGHVLQLTESSLTATAWGASTQVKQEIHMPLCTKLETPKLIIATHTMAFSLTDAV